MLDWLLSLIWILISAIGIAIIWLFLASMIVMPVAAAFCAVWFAVTWWREVRR